MTFRQVAAEIRTALANPHALSPLLLGWWACSLLFRAVTGDTFWGLVPLRMVVAQVVSMIAVTCLIAALARLTWLRPAVHGNARARRTAVTYLGICAMTFAVQAAWDQRWDFSFGLVIVRTLLSMLLLVVLAYLIDQRDQQRRAISSVLAETQRLSLMRFRYASELQRMRAELAELVSARVGPALSECIELLSLSPLSPAQLRSCAAAVRDCELRIVRELSHSLDGAPVQTAQLPGESGTAEGMLGRAGRDERWPGLLRHAVTDRPFWPPGVILIASAGAAASAVPVRGPGIGALCALVTGMCVACLTIAADRFLTPLLPRLPVAARMLAILGVFAAAGIATAALLGAVFTLAIGPRIAVVACLGTTAIAVTLGLIRAVAQSRRRLLRQLSATLDSVSWEAGRLGDAELEMRREIAGMLHGDIQGSLMAVALQLNSLADSIEQGPRRASDGAQRQELAVGSAVSVLELASARIAAVAQQRGPVHVADIQSALAAAASVWSEIIVVRIDCPDEVGARIDLSPAVATAVAVAARESIANASRHGNARNGTVRLRIIGGCVELRVTDDGSGFSANYVPGLGLTSIIRSGASVSVATAPTGGGELVVRLPIS